MHGRRAADHTANMGSRWANRRLATSTARVASSDAELYNAVELGLATLPDAVIVGISTPHKRSGLLFEKWRDHYGQDGDEVLVVRGPSLLFNPTLNPKIVEAASRSACGSSSER